MHHRFIRCLKIFSWALDIVSGTQYAQCTDALSWTVGSTGAYRLTWLRFPSAPRYYGVGSSDYHRMLRCPGVGSSGAPESKSSDTRRGGPLGLATPIFSLSSLEPKSLRMVIFNNHISPSVVCVINRQNIILKYGMRGHFRYTLVCPAPSYCD